MKQLWKILYLGLDPSRFVHEGVLTHHPLIQIQALPLEDVKEAFGTHGAWTHLIFTSQTGVSLFFEVCQKLKITLPPLECIVVGKATEAKLRIYGEFKIRVAQKECAEGVVECLEKMDLKNAHLFFPHSTLARTTIVDFLKKEGISYTEALLYKPISLEKIPALKIEEFDEIVFTSPSIVDAYMKIFGRLPKQKKLTAIGVVTQKRMDNFLERNYSHD